MVDGSNTRMVVDGSCDTRMVVDGSCNTRMVVEGSRVEVNAILL
jgi:hypothetical protein